MRTAVRELLGDRLWSLAHLAAERAVRRRGADFLSQALASLALGSKWIDPRDILVAFSLVSHSAGKLRVDYRRVFKAAQDLADSEFAELVEDWLERSPYERSIDGMGKKEDRRGKLFKYVDDDEDD